jgi:hypothetical protein
MKNFVRKLQKSARTYLLITTAGSMALVAAPGVALYQLLKPEPSKEALQKRRKAFEQVMGHFSKWGDTITEGILEASSEINETMGQALWPEGQEEWMREHKKLYKDKKKKK